MAVTAKKKTRPKATGKGPGLAPSPVSTGGQWLKAWQAKNPGMFQPGVSLAQAQAQVPGFNPALLTSDPNSDPAWIAAALKGGAAPGGAGAGAGGAGAPAAGPESDPMSAELSRILSGIQRSGDEALALRDHNRGELNRLYLDESNPFSQKNLLAKAFRETKLGTVTSMAARGQIYAGAFKEQQGIDYDNASKAEHAMLEEFKAKNDANDAAYNETMAGLRGRGDDAMLAEALNTSALENRRDLPEGDNAMAAAAAPAAAPGGAVSWATWNSWSPAMRDRYRARHRDKWESWRPR